MMTMDSTRLQELENALDTAFARFLAESDAGARAAATGARDALQRAYDAFARELNAIETEAKPFLCETVRRETERKLSDVRAALGLS